jgi:hypothetical protein
MGISMAVRTQQESEQPAKVYQLDAVESKVDAALNKLDTVITQTRGLVTETQLSAVKKEMEEYVDSEISKVHLEYRPTKRNAAWLVKLVIGQIVTLIIGSAVAGIFLLS